MNKILKQSIATMLSFALLFSFIPTPVFATEEDEVTITVLATSDLHGRIYPYEYATGSDDMDAGLAKIMTLVKQERVTNPDALLIDCGDTLQDNSAELFNKLDVHPMIQAMNAMGYDSWTLGNHEFNFGLDFLNKNIAAFEGSVLAANIYNTTTGERFVKPYEIFTVKGVRVAIVGILPPSITLWEASTPAHFENMKFTGVVEETEKVLAEIKGKYDVLVGAYHIGPTGEHGYDGLDVVTAKFPEFDVIFGGHAHSQIAKEMNGVQVIEPGRYGWALGKANIQLAKKDGAWSVQLVEGTNIPSTKDVVADPEILSEFAFVDQQSQADANTIVGKITGDFIARPDYITGATSVSTLPTAQIVDTPVMDLINEVQAYYTKADVSSAALFKNNSNLLMGDFKKKDVAFIYMYDNTLIGVNITGAHLLDYMEWSATYYNTAKEGDINISFNKDIRSYNYDMFSGINYDIDISKEPGRRIVNATINGKPIVDSQIYKLALNNYRFGTLLSLNLVTMADKYYDSFEVLQDAGRVRDLIIQYTKDVKKGTLAPTVDQNWKIIGFDFNNPYKKEVFQLVIDGKLTIPTSEDGRTPNVASLNVKTLIDNGTLKPMVVYSILPGDKLWKIAKNYGLTYQELAKLNNLTNPNLIIAGKTLIVPATK